MWVKKCLTVTGRLCENAKERYDSKRPSTWLFGMTNQLLLIISLAPLIKRLLRIMRFRQTLKRHGDNRKFIIALTAGNIKKCRKRLNGFFFFISSHEPLNEKCVLRTCTLYSSLASQAQLCGGRNNVVWPYPWSH